MISSGKLGKEYMGTLYYFCNFWAFCESTFKFTEESLIVTHLCPVNYGRVGGRTMPGSNLPVSIHFQNNRDEKKSSGSDQ